MFNSYSRQRPQEAKKFHSLGAYPPNLRRPVFKMIFMDVNQSANSGSNN
jgi:hypothetical protein